MQGISLLFLFHIIVIVKCSIPIGQIRSAAYIPENFTDVNVYNGSCSECICYAFISNQSSTYKALNCYTNNASCLLFRTSLSKSYIRINTNSTLIFRSLPTNTTIENCIGVYDQCGGFSWNRTTNCCADLSCVYVNQSYSWCFPTSSLPSTSLTTERLTTGVADDATRQNGSSGTYWGCCKPSCSWSNKAPVSSPVKACEQDGFTEVNSSTPSVCVNGQSHMCINQQPWNVSDNLSYGYAGVYVIDQSEWTWCCACYSLVFTSSSLAGKEIIVQAVNTAYSSNNLFALHIPGGGWTGTTNGCSTQFGSSFGWGQQNGGVSNRSQCANLPSALQPGCYWRFDWFMNTVNPNVRFKQVTCPSILTNITGCIRL